ncbi:MAG: ABC transporter substrate-binding protein [Azoarcus sp.]|jgi:ABC-type Fe3+ transport system substrate-binding protein|nr:ABC transporter substrate-binding protein [Azoarcus sp.]
MNAPHHSLDRRPPAPAVPPRPDAANDAANTVEPASDLLGRLPVSLCRPFRTGLKAALSPLRQSDCRIFSGAQWHTPFDRLADWPASRLPALLVTNLHADLFAPDLLRHYTPKRPPPAAPLHPACEAAGLRDEHGIFRSFALAPFVFLVDGARLRGRPAPRAWADLLDPMWMDEIIFGCWLPGETNTYHDYCGYLLLCLYLEFGTAGLIAFAANVRRSQHDLHPAAQTGAIAVLPWLHTELRPRREHMRVVWPEDGALVMPISWSLKRGAESAAAPLIDYLQSRELGAILARNAYPPIHLAAGAATAYPPGVRLKWPGWTYFHTGNMAADSAAASGIFLAAWYGLHGIPEKRAAPRAP